jgi:hypothetical protein
VISENKRFGLQFAFMQARALSSISHENSCEKGTPSNRNASIGASKPEQSVATVKRLGSSKRDEHIRPLASNRTLLSSQQTWHGQSGEIEPEDARRTRHSYGPQMRLLHAWFLRF